MAKDLWNIEKEFERMRRQMNHLMNRMFGDSFDNVSLLGTSKDNSLMDISYRTPAADIYETENEVIAKIEVPGIDKENIKLEVRNGMLNLKAEQKEEKEDKDDKKGYYRIERSYSGFARSFSLSVEVDENNIKAKCKDGILEVHMQKKETNKKEGVKYINIE